MHSMVEWSSANFYRQYIQESMGEEAAEKAAAGGIVAGEKISRSTLEEEARQSTLKGRGTPEEKFWQRQQGQAETIAIGKSYIAKVSLFQCGRMNVADLARPLQTRRKRRRRSCRPDDQKRGIRHVNATNRRASA